jgi:hypothetical protein
MSLIIGPSIHTDFFMQGKLAFVCTSSGVLKVIDFTFPRDPLKIGSLSLSAAFGAIYVYQNLACLADLLGGNLFVVDVSDPTVPVQAVGSPVHVSRINGPRGVYVDGTRAYLSGCIPLDGSSPGDNQIVVVDLTTFTIVGSLGTGTSNGDLESIFGAGNVAASSGANGTKLVSLGNPVQPAIGATDPTICDRVFLKGQHCYGVSLGIHPTISDWLIGGFGCVAGDFGALKAGNGDVDYLRGRRADFSQDITARAFRGKQFWYEKTADPTTSDLGNGEWALWHNSTLGEIRFWVNSGGVLFKSAPFT